MADSRFSVVITSYNQKEFIRDAVDSALALSLPPRELIVVDDGSSDGSPELLGEYGSAIRLLRLEMNRGKGAARNTGAAVATGDYLVFLDGDDAFLPWALEVCERVAEARRPALILCPMKYFGGALPDSCHMERPAAIRLVEYADYFRKDRPFGVSASSVVIRRDAFERVGGWSGYPVLQDQDLVIRLGTSGPVVHVLLPPTTFHRNHPGQTVHQVAPFLEVLSDMLEQQRVSRRYPGGEARRFERAAILGGQVFFWVKRARRARLTRAALLLFASNVPLIVAAVVQRATAIAKGRHAEEVIAL